MIYFIATLWGIWIARINSIFRGDKSTLIQIRVAVDVASAQHDKYSLLVEHRLRFLHPPDIDSVQPPGYLMTDIGQHYSTSAKILHTS